MKVLSVPHNFLLIPSPGWTQLTRYELQYLLSPHRSWTTYKFQPKITLLNSSSPHSSLSSSPLSLSFSLSSVNSSPSSSLSSSTSIICVENCDYRQILEISSKILSIHDIEWILFKKKCQNEKELFQYFDVIQQQLSICLGRDLSQLQILFYSNQSFKNSSKYLKECFYSKQTPHSHGHSPDTTQNPHTPHQSSQNNQDKDTEQYSDQRAISSHTSNQLRSLSPQTSRVKIHLIKNVLSVSVSFGGTDLPLYRRGYKYLSLLSRKNCLNQSHSECETQNSFTLSSMSQCQDQKTETVQGIETENGRLDQKLLAIAPLPEHHAAACFQWMILMSASHLLRKEQTERELSPSAASLSSSSSSSPSSTQEPLYDQYDQIRQNIKKIIVPFAGTGKNYTQFYPQTMCRYPWI